MINPEGRLSIIWNNKEIRPYRVVVPASMVLTCLTVLATGGGPKDVAAISIAVGAVVAFLISKRLSRLDKIQSRGVISSQ